MNQPPVVPRLAVRWLAPRHRWEEIDGDLLELFQVRVAEYGVTRARVSYWRDAASVMWRRRLWRPTDHGRRSLKPMMAAPGSPRRPTMTTAFNFLNELRLAARALSKRPAYAAIAAFTLALGIGSNVAIFAVLNAVLLRPLPYPDPDRIVEIRHYAPGLNLPEVRSSAGLNTRYRESAKTLIHVASFEIRLLNMSGNGVPERIRTVVASPDLFSALGVGPALGRAFHESDAHLNARRVAILTDTLWQTRFGADRGIIGRTLQLDGHEVEVVGVMPKGFGFPDPEARLYVPRPSDPTEGFGAFGTSAVARLRPGVSLHSANTEIQQLQHRIPEWYPDLTTELLARFGWSAAVTPWRDRVVGDVSRTLWVLFGTVGLVLLIAGANVANLFLVRAEARQREAAIRMTLGAGRGRLTLTLLAESVVLTSLGGAVGLLLAAAGTRLLITFGPSRLPRLQEVSIDLTIVLFTVALTAISAIVLGTLPSLKLARGSSASVLRDGGRGTTQGRSRHRTRQALIVAQVAMAVVLLIASGLTLRSVARLSAVDPGFTVDGVLTAGMSLSRGTDRARAIAFYRQVLTDMASLPGVTAVGAASSLPVGATSVRGGGFQIRSRPTAADDVPTSSMYAAVTPGFFETINLPILQGRAPEAADADQNRPVVWVNRTFARRFLGDRAIGESIQFRDTWLEVVGVVGDVRLFGLDKEVQPMAYLPLSNPVESLEVMHAVIRSSGDPASLAPSLRRAIDRIDPTMPLTGVRTMSDIIDASLAQPTFTVTLLTIAAGIALVLGVVGLYGVISYIVTQRTAEIGVRLALGARPARVCVMVLQQGITVASIGVIVGLASAWASTHVMGSMLFEVSAQDPLTFVGVSCILLAVSVMATYLPARKAASLDPVTAMRDDR